MKIINMLYDILYYIPNPVSYVRKLFTPSIQLKEKASHDEYQVLIENNHIVKNFDSRKKTQDIQMPDKKEEKDIIFSIADYIPNPVSYVCRLFTTPTQPKEEKNNDDYQILNKKVDGG